MTPDLLREIQHHERVPFMLGYAIAKQEALADLEQQIQAVLDKVIPEYDKRVGAVAREAIAAGALAAATAKRQPGKVGHATGQTDDESLSAAALACLRDTNLARGRSIRKVTVLLAEPTAEPQPARIEYQIELE